MYGAPCVPDTLANYVALASTGCEVGPNFRFRDFGAIIVDAVVLGDLPSDAEIIITPTLGPMGPALTFTPGAGTSWDAGGLLGTYTGIFGFTVESINPFWNFLGSGLSATGDASGLAVATIAEVQCLGGVFNGFGLPLPACLGGGVTANLAANLTGALGAEVDAAIVYAPVTEIDVIKVLDVTGTFLGTARIDSFTESFTAQDSTPVPEPTTVSLLGGSLLAIAWFHRRKAQKG
jgi:hypothetical protein